VTDSMEPMPTRIDHSSLLRILVDAGRTDGVELIGPHGLLTGLTKTVLETSTTPMGRMARIPATAPARSRC
jgi:putative transposase